MTKKRHLRFLRNRILEKWIIMMKLITFLLFVSCMQVMAVAYSQNARVSFSVKNSQLEKVFDLLEEQSGYSFVYNHEQLKSAGLITADFKNETVASILQYCLQGTGLSYEFLNNTIIIRQVEEGRVALTLRGFVWDTKKQPLPGVTVKLVGTSVGTATDAKGWFSVKLPVMKGQLEFSFVGFKKHIVTFTTETARDTLHVILQEDVQAMEEVVVTGYGNVTKGNYTGASTTIRAENIMMAGVSSIDQMLQGVVPGMLVMNKTGLVGASPKIRVRGTSSLLGSQEPVWVVDGVIQRDPQPFNPEDNTKFSADADDIKQLAGNAISWLNPNDIETITVLKDASATAIYGSQAANGVIVITTKKAIAGKVQISYSGDFSIGQRPHYGLYDLMNSAERMQLSQDIYKEQRKFDPNDIILSIGYEGLLKRYLNKEISLSEMDKEYQNMARQNTDWFDILFRNSFNHSHNVSFSGGSDKIQNRTSLSFTSEDGEVKGNSLTQFAATSNTTINISEKLRVNLLLNGSSRQVKGFAYEVDPFKYAYNTSRVIPAFNPDGSYYFHEKLSEEESTVGYTSIYNYNILNELANTGSRNVTRTWGATVDLKWEILSGLEYQGLVAYSSSSADTKKHATEHSFYITQIRSYEYGAYAPSAPEIEYSRLPMGGLLETDLTNVTSVTVRNALVYDHLFKEKHRVTLQLGIETNSVKTRGEANKRYGYLPNRGELFANPPAVYNPLGWYEEDNTEIGQGEHKVLNRVENKLSEYGMAVYTYDDRYVFNFSARMDASNRFGQDKNKRFQPTWSAGLKWRMASESFSRDLWWLNNLDLYGSYGYQGNSVETVSPFLITKTSFIEEYSSYGLEIQSLPYPNLGWEKTKTWNIGVDGAFLEGRLNFTFNYFKKISSVLSSRGVPQENGVENGIVSGSTMHNDGYEFVINVVPVQTKDFTWQLSLNTSVTRNRVEKNSRQNTLDDYLNGSGVIDGRPFSTFYSYQFDGLEQEYGQPIFKDLDIEDGKSPKDFLVESGKLIPDFSGGLNMLFKYRQFSLYALFAVQWGGHDRLPDLYSGDGLPRSEQNVSRKLQDRWKKTGDKTTIPSLPLIDNEWISVPATQTSNRMNKSRYAMYNQSDVRVANTDFIRCRSLSLSYNFKGEWLQQTGINYLQVKASMTNPFMWVSDKKWDGLDPETGDWPSRRVTSLSLQVIF